MQLSAPVEVLKGTLLVTPASYDFGSVSPGNVATTSFQVKNIGRGTFLVKDIALQTADSHVTISGIFTLDCNARPAPDPV